MENPSRSSLDPGKTPHPEQRRNFSTLEVSFFDTGTGIETGQVPVADEHHLQPASPMRRWLRHRAWLLAAGTAGLLVVVAVWLASGNDTAPATPAGIQQSAAAIPIAKPPAPAAGPSPGYAPAPSPGRPRTTPASRSTR
jgi:ferric-dicitrate binding protein FerR (iron transport regulator)